jgi:hypothetical protein
MIRYCRNFLESGAVILSFLLSLSSSIQLVAQAHPLLCTSAACFQRTALYHLAVGICHLYTICRFVRNTNPDTGSSIPVAMPPVPCQPVTIQRKDQPDMVWIFEE